MKKLHLSILLCFSTVFSSLACGGGDWDENDWYYNLFMQEIIDDPMYFPFLRTDNYSYSSFPQGKNQNIEQWQSYLGLSYEETEFLVFGATKEQIDGLIKKQPLTDTRLSFATGAWTKKHHQSLLYLSYAKYLESYMIIVPDYGEYGDRSWRYERHCYKTYKTYQFHAGDLDYDKVMNVLRRSWSAETDKELKLRYGYQMVRLAHYTRRYEEAIDLFNQFVEPLNYRPAIYYYALSQRAGAERGLGNWAEASYHFLKVFSNSNDMKEHAFLAVSFPNNETFREFLQRAESTSELNDAYLFMGYGDFNNPLAMAEEIVQHSPDAVQAKVLMARAVNEIERHFNVTSFRYKKTFPEDKRYPFAQENDWYHNDINKFLRQTLDFSLKMTKNEQVSELDFWNLTTAYLYFLKKDFDSAKTYLAKVGEKNELYKKQKELFADYIYISEQPKITPEVENEFLKIYRKYSREYSGGFLVDVLANRYFLQEDYAKSFLMNNSIFALEAFVEPDLLVEIENLVTKPDKNEWEKSLIWNATDQFQVYSNSTIGGHNDMVLQYISYLWGNYYLSIGDLENALTAFSKIPPTFKWRDFSGYGLTDSDYQGFTGISNKVFGYNQIECFECPSERVMKNDFSAQFPFIKKTMNKKELVEALIQLQKIGKQNNETGAKANYLLGNFFYNVSLTGYYRHILRFDLTNGPNSAKFSGRQKPKNIYNGIYFKDYWQFLNYYDQPAIANEFLETAYKQAKDSELKARIAFALSKLNRDTSLRVGKYKEEIDFSEEYFAELAKYKGTRFYDEVKTHCKYFEYYVNQFK